MPIKTVDDLIRYALKEMPHAIVDVDKNGELTISTGFISVDDQLVAVTE
jgi:hypothetical protein